MPKLFNPARSWRQSRDVRDWDDLVDIEDEAHGLFWVLLGPRRCGKTWGLRGLRALHGGEYFDLRQSRRAFADYRRDGPLFADEPGAWLSRDPESFLQACDNHKRAGRRVVVAMTPGEWARVCEDVGPGYINSHDILRLEPLTPEQRSALAGRCDWASDQLDHIGETWCRNPFHLELLLCVAEMVPELQGDLPALARKARDYAEREFRYFHQVYKDGLSEAQRGVLRATVSGASSGDEYNDNLLERAGMICCYDDRAPSLEDPLLAFHLPPPLVIHHVSDVHVGAKSADTIDLKASDRIPGAGKAAGARPKRDAYVDHVRALCERGSGPRLVIVSGDIVEWGQDDEYAQAKVWLERLEAAIAGVAHADIPDDADRILLVGGNHDVDWSATSARHAPTRRHERFVAELGRWKMPRLDQPPEERELQVVAFPGFNLEIILLGSAEFGGQLESDPLLEAIRQKRQALIKKKALESVARVDPGLVHHTQLEKLEQLANGATLRIAVLHHPVSPLPSVEVARYAGLLNAGAVKATLFQSRVALALHGHVHQGWFGEERWCDRYGNRPLHIAAAPSLGSREVSDQNGYNELTLCREKNHIRVVVKRWVIEAGSWRPESELNFSCAPPD